ncbi:hypothetical protein D3C71_20700 [compost metagenome]
MLAFKLDRTTCVLEVEETMSSGHKSTTRYFYYDLLKWMCSSNGLKGDTPDREMTPGAIDWVRRTYLPLLNLKGRRAPA